MSNGDPPQPEDETRSNPQLEPIYDFLQSVSQRFQKDMQAPKPELDLSSQLERALRQFAKGAFADRIAADLPYGIAMALGGWMVDSFTGRRAAAPPPAGEAKKAARSFTVEELLAVEPVRVELGRSLVPLVTGKSPLIHKITTLRHYLAHSLGLILPGVRLVDSQALEPEQYRVLIDEIPVGSGKLQVDHFLIIGPTHKLELLGLTPAPDPVYAMPSAWIPVSRKREAEKEGCMPFDPSTTLASHMTRLLRRHGYRLLGRQQTGVLLKVAEKNQPHVVRQARRQLRPGLLRQVLRQLLAEQVSIRRLSTILEAMLDCAEETYDADLLTEAARASLGRQLTLEYESPEGTFNCLELEAELVAALRLSLVPSGKGSGRLELDRELSRSLESELASGLQVLANLGLWPALVTEPDLRLPLQRWSRARFADLVVLSYPELDPEVSLESHGQLRLVDE